MKALLSALLITLALTVFAGAVQAGELPEVGEQITVTGIVVFMDDSMYIDDGTRLYLLMDLDDSDYEGLTIDAFGTFLMIDERPALEVHEILILKDRTGDDNEQDSSDNKG